MLLSPDSLQALTTAMPLAFNGAGLSEAEYQRFYDAVESYAPKIAKPCRTPRLATNLVLDMCDLNTVLGATLDVDFSTFCSVYDTFVEDGLINKASMFRKPWKFFGETLELIDEEAHFYFDSPKPAPVYDWERHLHSLLPILAQFAVKNYDGVVTKDNGDTYRVEARGEAFGIASGRPITKIKGAEKQAIVFRYGVSKIWQAGPRGLGRPTIADGAYKVLAEAQIAPEIKLPILEGISLMRWMGGKDTFHDMMLGIGRMPLKDAAASRAGKIAAVEQAMHFEWFSDVTREMRGLLVPIVISPHEFKRLFHRVVRKGSDMTPRVIQNWTENLTQLHRSISDAE